MTKQEQIEEIAKDIHRVCTACSGEMFDEYTCDRCQAKLLIEKCYQKLPKDSVVLSREEYEKLKMLEECHITCEDVLEFVEKARKETAEKFAKLIEFHSISKRDESGYETFTISNLCMREILREEFGFTNEELETM